MRRTSEHKNRPEHFLQFRIFLWLYRGVFLQLCNQWRTKPDNTCSNSHRSLQRSYPPCNREGSTWWCKRCSCRSIRIIHVWIRPFRWFCTNCRKVITAYESYIRYISVMQKEKIVRNYSKVGIVNSICYMQSVVRYKSEWEPLSTCLHCALQYLCNSLISCKTVYFISQVSSSFSVVT